MGVPLRKEHSSKKGREFSSFLREKVFVFGVTPPWIPFWGGGEKKNSLGLVGEAPLLIGPPSTKGVNGFLCAPRRKNPL